MESPDQIMKKLDEGDRGILNKILIVERGKMHVQNIKANSRDEKEIVKDIVKIIDEAVKNAD